MSFSNPFLFSLFLNKIFAFSKDTIYQTLLKTAKYTRCRLFQTNNFSSTFGFRFCQNAQWSPHPISFSSHLPDLAWLDLQHHFPFGWLVPSTWFVFRCNCCRIYSASLGVKTCKIATKNTWKTLESRRGFFIKDRARWKCVWTLWLSA